MQWSPQQHEALVAVQKWMDTPEDVRPQIFRLFGYAGSGKTTLAIEISKMCDGDSLFASFTGKAALVMRKKGCRGAQTLHSLIYKPRRKNRGDEESDKDIPMWELNPESALASADLLIIDECSMVGEELLPIGAGRAPNLGDRGLRFRGVEGVPNEPHVAGRVGVGLLRLGIGLCRASGPRLCGLLGRRGIQFGVRPVAADGPLGRCGLRALCGRVGIAGDCLAYGVSFCRLV